MISIFARTLASVLIAAHLFACAAPPPTGVSEAQRARMGAVGVAPFAMTPRDELQVTRGTAAGAAGGAIEGVIAGVASTGGCGFGCVIVVPFMASVGAITGGVVGGAAAVPEDKAAEIETRLKAVLSEVGDQARLQAAVVVAAIRFGVPRVTTLPGKAVAVRGVDAEAKVDTILKVGLVSVGLAGGGGADPELAIRVSALARLVDARTDAELYRTRLFTHAVGPRKFSEWNADNARLLKDALERAYQSLARSIVDEIFLVIRTN